MFRTFALFLALVPCEALVVGVRALTPSASGVVARSPLRNVRAQEEPLPPPPSSRLGATVDQDGKSNVWVSATAVALECGPHALPQSRF